MKMYLENYLNNLRTPRLLFLLSLFGWVWSCQQQPTTEAQRDIIVAYGEDELSRAELEYFLPEAISKEDSAKFAQSYIEEWVRMRAIAEKAKENIQGVDEKIRYKLKNYEYELIEHEYAGWLTSPEQMDAIVSEADIRNYYEKFPDKFISRANYFQYFHVMSDVPRQYKAVTLMSSSNTEDIEELKEWVKENAIESNLDSSFVEITELNRIGKGYNHGRIDRQQLNVVYPYDYEEDGKKFYNYLKMIKIIRPGDPMPYSMCRELIRATIQNDKKNDLIKKATKDLTEAAKSSGKLKILR